MNLITKSIEKKITPVKTFLIDADRNEESNKELKVTVANLLIYEYRRMFVEDLNLYKNIWSKSFAFNYTEHLVPSPNACLGFEEEMSSLLNDTEFSAFFDGSGHFNNEKFNNPSFVYMLLKKAKTLMQTMPNLRECNLLYEEDQTEQEIDTNSCIIIGDLCGSLNDFFYLVEEFGIPGSKKAWIFNGNLVHLDTQSKNQIDLLLLVCYGFVLRPDRVFINRGSHDDIYSSLVQILDSDQPSLLQLIRQRYDVYSTAIFNSIIDLFAHLSLGTVLINKLTKIFIVSSGINDKLNIEFIQNKVKRHEILDLTNLDDENELMKYMFESMPRRNYQKDDVDDELGSYRCYKSNELEFDVQQTENFCETNDLSCIIRSNELVKDGFSLDHSKCFTVFSASNFYNSNNMGAVLKLSSNESALEPYIYNNNYNKTSTFSSIQDQLKYLIQLNKRDLNAKFEIRDKMKTGSLKFDQFSNILVDYFGKLDTLQIKEHFVDDYDKETKKIEYSSLFSSSQHESARHLKKILFNIFNMLDIDFDQRVSIVELKETLVFVKNSQEKSHLELKNVCKCIIEHLDNSSFFTSSNSNEICLNEFQDAISSVLEADSIIKNLNIDDDEEEREESCKEFTVSSENGNEDISDEDSGDEEGDEEGKEESDNENESEDEDDDSKSINSESSEDGPLQLVRL